MPIDRGVIDQQLRALDQSPSWWEQRELRDLPTVLHADERILAIARGKLGRPRWLRRSWLIVVTEGRLLCLRSARAGWSQIEVSASLIARVALRIGPFRGRVVIVAGGRTYRVLVPRQEAYRLSSALTTIGPATRDSAPSFQPALMARRVIDHVLALPAIALKPDSHAPARPPAADPAIGQHMESLEEQVTELRKQVDFLQQLLHRQQVGAGPDRKLRAD